MIVFRQFCGTETRKRDSRFSARLPKEKHNRESISSQRVLTTKKPIADCFRDCFRSLFEWQTRSVRNNGSGTLPWMGRIRRRRLR